MPVKFYKLLLTLVIAAVLTVLPAVWFSADETPRLEIDYLDVGQGDAILIKTPYGQNILVDGGPNNKILEELGENLPVWDRTIDLVILTHPHDDHVNGLNEVIKRYEITKILSTGVIHTAPGYINFLKNIKEYEVPLTIIDRPQTLVLGENCEIKILYPDKSFYTKETDNLNNTSIVFNLKFGETNFLFMGDAEKEVEEKLIKNDDLKAQVLKVGHHGSDTASSKNFLEKVTPNLAVIEVGKSNKFNHPNLRVINRLERIGAKIYRTDLDGTIKITSDSKVIDIIEQD